MFSMFKKSSDPYEEMLNGLKRRILNGETISMMDFLYVLDDLADEPDEIPTDAEIREAADAREWFLSELRRFGLPLETRHTLCRTLYEKANAEPSQALLRLLCYILCDDGTLLDIDPELHSPEQDALCWRRIRREAETLYAKLSLWKQMSVRFGELLEKLKELRPVALASAEADKARVSQIRKAYARIFKLKGSQTQLSDNIAVLLQLADSNPNLAAVKPLFLYRVLTRHGARLQKSPDLRLDFRALWKRHDYKIDDDNGKNHKTYAKYLALFESLYRLFETDETVDAPLCLYGFDHLSNLGEFYRMACPENKRTIPFEMSLEELLSEMECVFSCYEHGEGDNILLEDSGLSVMKLDRFQSGKNPRWKRGLSLVEKYFNRNLAELTERFLQSNPEQVRALCREILEASDLPEELRPENETETVLFLAAINGGLMESVDNCAEYYLLEACKILIGDSVEREETRLTPSAT